MGTDRLAFRPTASPTTIPPTSPASTGAPRGELDSSSDSPLSTRLLAHLQLLYGADWKLHLEPEAPAEPPPCVTCQGAGWVVERSARPGAPSTGTIHPCPACKVQAIEKRRIDRIFGAAAIPPRLAPLTFASYAALGDRGDQTCRAGLELWAEHGPGSIYLYGKVGRGKSALAKCALEARMASHIGTTGLFMATPDLLGRIRDSYSKAEGAPTEAEVIDAATTVDLLVLDDIGVDKATDWVTATLYRVLNTRYLGEKPTIFTSNLTPELLGRQLGGRISWRVGDMCGPNILEVQGDNLRAGQEGP